MFENLSDRLSGVLGRLTKAGALSDEDVATALREVRVALLEADVSLPVARDFIKAVGEKATRPGGDEIGHAGPAGGEDRP
jgi:signal recognition particle subunit SRP54